MWSWVDIEVEKTQCSPSPEASDAFLMQDLPAPVSQHCQLGNILTQQGSHRSISILLKLWSKYLGWWILMTTASSNRKGHSYLWDLSYVCPNHILMFHANLRFFLCDNAANENLGAGLVVWIHAICILVRPHRLHLYKSDACKTQLMKKLMMFGPCTLIHLSHVPNRNGSVKFQTSRCSRSQRAAWSLHQNRDAAQWCYSSLGDATGLGK